MMRTRALVCVHTRTHRNALFVLVCVGAVCVCVNVRGVCVFVRACVDVCQNVGLCA